MSNDLVTYNPSEGYQEIPKFRAWDTLITGGPLENQEERYQVPPAKIKGSSD